jgi:hypothetical protein
VLVRRAPCTPDRLRAAILVLHEARTVT